MSFLRVATTLGAAASAAALTFQMTTKPVHNDQKRPEQSPALPDVADRRPAFSEGFVGMVGNTPLVLQKEKLTFFRAQFLNSPRFRSRFALNRSRTQLAATFMARPST